MHIQQEGVLELLTIHDPSLVCLDINSNSPSISIGMAKRGVHAYVQNADRDIILNIKYYAKLLKINNKISFFKITDEHPKFDFVLLTQTKLDIEKIAKGYECLTQKGVLVLDISNTSLEKLERILKTIKVSGSQIYIPFGDDNAAVFILPKEEVNKYYYRYWSWKRINPKFLLTKLVEYCIVFKLNRLWTVSRFIVLLEK